MRPIDPRLLRYARATRGFLGISVLLGAVSAAAIIVGAVALSAVLAGLVAGDPLGDYRGELQLLIAVAVVRAAAAWASEAAAQRSAAIAKQQLRAEVADAVLRLGPGWAAQQADSGLAVAATRGIDALDSYFSRYLPQLVLAVIVPVAILAVLITADWISFAIVAVTLPLIPLFMALVGLATRTATDRQHAQLSRLSRFFLDLLGGLTTLTVFGRATAQQRRVAELTDSYRSATMRVLRISFLSALVLELLATLSVALVAVSIGVRLVEGGMDLRTGLLVLILAPEAYLPLRLVGLHYHAGADALSAADRLLAVLAEPVPAAGSAVLAAPATAALELADVTLRYPDRAGPAVERFSLQVAAGETVALVGPSGSGKSTVLAALLGFVTPEAGSVAVTGDGARHRLADLDPVAWRRSIALVPQRPVLVGRTLREALALGRPEASDAEITERLSAVGMADVVAALPDGLATRAPERLPLSAGQRQRLAIVRALLRDAPILLLDEPTAGLDGPGEQQVLEVLREAAHDRTTVLVAHRPSLLTLADRVVTVPLPAVVGA